MGSTVVGLGRLLIGALFVIAGARKVMGWQGALGAIQSLGLPSMDIVGYPLVDIVLGAVIALEIGGGLMLITGLGARPAAWALAAFTLASSVLFHNFWTIADAAQYTNQFNHFMKNVAIVGGLLVVAGHAPSDDAEHY